MVKNKSAYQALLDCVEDFKSGKITKSEYWDLSKSISWNQVTKSQEWKERREQVIDKECSTCGSQEKLALISALSKKHNVLVSELRLTYHKWQSLEFDVSSVKLEEPESRETCPFCGTISVRFRKTTQDYACNYKKCKKEGFTQLKVVEYQRLSYEDQIIRARRRFVNDAIHERATLEGANATLRVLELRKEDVVTVCKDCLHKKKYKRKIL